MGADTYEEGKIFVGGLNQESTKETMRRHFSSFGNITDCVVMHDQTTGRSRGFGFVTFENAEAVDRLLAAPQIVDGKEVDCKRACPRDSTYTRQSGPPAFRTNKIFVGGLPDITKDEFQTYFEKYGRVIDAVLMQDKNNNRSRGFGFITFENKDVVEEVIRKYHDHVIKGKWVEVKKAQPKEQMMAMRSPMSGGGFPPKWGGIPQYYDGYRGGAAGGYNPYDSRGPYGGGSPLVGYDGYGHGGPGSYPSSSHYGGGLDTTRGRPYSPYGQSRGSMGGYPPADPYASPPYGGGYSNGTAAGGYGSQSSGGGYSSNPYATPSSLPPYGGGAGTQTYGNGRSYGGSGSQIVPEEARAPVGGGGGDGLGDAYNPYTLYANYGPQRVANRGTYQRSYPY